MAFFSGQDNLMLQQEGNDTNCFISLVVDTRGQYVARVTRKVQTTSEVIVKHLGKSYEFFGEGSKQLTVGGEETTKVVDNTVIEYFDLEVERHEVDNTLSYLDERFEEIEKKKAAQNKTNIEKATEMYNKELKMKNIDNKATFYGWYHNEKKQEVKEPSLFPEEETLTKEDESKIAEVTKVDWVPDAAKIHTAVVKMLTCSLIVNPEKVDLDQWVTKYMSKVYERIFEVEGDETILGAFEEWRDFIVQYTLDFFDIDGVPEAVLDNFDIFQSRVAEALGDEIVKYQETSPYIQDYLNTLNDYIVE
jgi:hypothetical protein